MKELVLGIWLGIQAGIDFKYKEIPLWFSVLGGILGICFCIKEERTVIEVVISCLPGIVAIGFSWITKEIMGYGDGIVLVVLGLYLSISEIMSLGMLAFGIAGIVALFMLVVLRKGRNYRIPFIPFLEIAYVIYWVTEWGEKVA